MVAEERPPTLRVVIIAPGVPKYVPVKTKKSPLGGLPPMIVAEKVFWTCSYAVNESEFVEAMYEDEVAEKALDTLKPFLVLPALENDKVKEAPATIIML